MANELTVNTYLSRANAILKARGDKEITWDQWVDYVDQQ